MSPWYPVPVPLCTAASPAIRLVSEAAAEPPAIPLHPAQGGPGGLHLPVRGREAGLQLGPAPPATPEDPGQHAEEETEQCRRHGPPRSMDVSMQKLGRKFFPEISGRPRRGRRRAIPESDAGWPQNLTGKFPGKFVCGYSARPAGAVPHSLPPRGPWALEWAFWGPFPGGAPSTSAGGPSRGPPPPYFLGAFSSALHRARRSPSLMNPHHAGLRVTAALQ